MTNYTLPETDRIAETVNPVFESVAQIEDTNALMGVEVGAVTVLGLLKESLEDFRDGIVAAALADGATEEDANASLDRILTVLGSIFQPRVEAFHAAVQAATEAAMQAEAQAFIEALLGGLGAPEDEAPSQGEPEPVGAGFYL